MRKRFLGVARAVLDILEARGQLDRDLAEAVAVAITQPSSIDARLTPLLDLSPRELDSPKIEQYCADHAIEFSNQTLYFNLFDGKRAEMFIGPTLETANFFFRNDDKNLLIVFAIVDGGFRSLAFVDGVYGGHYDSDETGKPIYQSIE